MKLQQSVSSKRMVALAIMLFAAAGMAAAAPLADGGFEGGSSGTAWIQSSTNFGTPLCDGSCGSAGAPYEGTWYAWFGGISGVVEEGTLTQQATIPAAPSVALSFYLRMPSVGTTGYLKVLVDDEQLFIVTEADSARYGSYTKVYVDISAKADGGLHTIKFDSRTDAGSGVLNILVDNVAVEELAPITGSVQINGNRSATSNRAVTLGLTWAGGADVVRMRFSDNGSTWTAWEPLAATRSYTLPEGADGHRTVRVQFLDKLNKRSDTFSDYIRLDTTPPTGTILINGGASTTASLDVTLGLTWADAGAGVARMRFSDNGSTWTAWMPTAATRSHTLPAGLGYHTVRVQYLDGANNYSPVYNDYIKVVAP